MLYTIQHIKRSVRSMLLLGLFNSYATTPEGGNTNRSEGVEGLNLKDKQAIAQNAQTIKDWLKNNVNRDIDTANITAYESLTTDGKFQELLAGLDLTVDYKQAGNKILLEKIIQRIDEYVGKRGMVQQETRINIDTDRKNGQLPPVPELKLTSLEKNPDMSVIESFNEHLSKRDKAKVRELQTALNHNGAQLVVDGIWGPNTRTALNTAKSTLNGYNPNSTFESTRAQIENTNNAMLDMQTKIEVTAAINENYAEFKDNAKRGHSIVGILKTILHGDKYAQFINSIDTRSIDEGAASFRSKLTSKGDAAKLYRAIDTLTTRDRKEREEPGHSGQVHETMEHVRGVLPWLVGIYITDIPLPFFKEMLPGANINKVMLFKQWIEQGMPGQFWDYQHHNEIQEVNPQKEQHKLINMLSSLNLTEEQKVQVLKGDLSVLDSNTKATIKGYMENILLPNVTIMTEESWGIFERGLLFIFKDPKYTKIQPILENFKKTKSISYNELSSIFEAMGKEGDVSAAIIQSQNNDAKYMDNVNTNRQTINQMGEVLGTGFSDINALYRFLNHKDPRSLGLESQSDMNSYNSLMQILQNNPTQAAIADWTQRNPNTYKFIQGLNNPQKMKEYRLSKLENGSGLHKATLESRLAHGGKLTGNPAQDSKTLFESTPDGKLSTFDYIYKGMLEKMGMTAISREQLQRAMKNMKKVPLSSIPDQPVINTGRTTEARNTITSFKGLASHGDTYVMQLEPIQTEYTFRNKNGNIETVQITTDIFLRPDCSNLLIVPNSVKVQGKEVSPQFIGNTLIQTRKFIPLVIPWSVFKTPSDNPPGGTPDNPPGETPDNPPITPSDNPPITTPDQTVVKSNISTGDVSSTPITQSVTDVQKLGQAPDIAVHGAQELTGVDSLAESTAGAAEATAGAAEATAGAAEATGGTVSGSTFASGFPSN